ncbi:hypothetical protein N7470_007147 [Penicillium chermesinum]|nr:hypothetical protein N7470_007147 [Penicillium chermesinum]
MATEAVPDTTPIAIIGYGYRAPGIGRKGLWEYLSQARSAWSKIPSSRFDHSAFANTLNGPDRAGVFKIDGAHFLPDDVYAFDAPFFNMRPEEAKNTDPQFRLALECALEAAEDAGYSLTDLNGQRIGVFMGAGQHEYSTNLTDDQFFPGTFSATGVAPCMLSNRVSYFLNIDGPSVALDAACASSVYASHIAMASVRNGDCTAAFVGAASLNLGPGGWLALGKTGALSKHGRSYSYDEKGTGFGRGEGAGCFLIKRLDDAIRDGDPVHAVLRGSACNHGGRSEGITMPNGNAHQKLIRRAHESAGLDVRRTAVIEGHGTGTGAGDPIEASAFTKVLGAERTSENPLYIGSLKSNFGHLEGASGLVGMIKAVLMLQHGKVLPTAGFEKINPKIASLEKIVVPTAPMDWPAGEERRMLITNFGFGGSNAAIVIDGPPERSLPEATPLSGEEKRLFVFSAKNELSLKGFLSEFEEYLEDEAPESPEFVRDLSYTLGQRRTHFAYRAFGVSDSVEALQEKVSAAKPARIKDRVIGFVFTGQGAQYAEMAVGLRSYPVFAQSLQDAEKKLQEIGAPWSLVEELSKPSADSRINDAELSQPACTAVQLAIVALLKSWGVTPRAVTGHSSGEIAAAYTAGLLSFDAAIAASFFRGQAAARLLATQKKGAMAAIGVGAEEARKLIEESANGYATVAAINSPRSVTVSGDPEAIDNVHAAAEKQGLFARKLKVEMAYHSQHMEEVAEWYLESIKPYFQSTTSESTAAFVSSVFAGAVEPSAVDASYWVKNLVQPVRFSEAIDVLSTLATEGHKNSIPNVIVEIGPHAALKGPIKQTVDAAIEKGGAPQLSSLVYSPSLVRGTQAQEAILELAGTLFTLGVPIDLGAVNQTSKANANVVTGLPKYSWDKSTVYRVAPRASVEKKHPGDSYHPLLGRPQISVGGLERVYRQVFNLDEMPWVRDHVVGGVVVFPMTGYLSCAIEACRRMTGKPAESFLLRNVYIKQRLEVLEEQTIDISTRIRPVNGSPNRWSWEVASWAEKDGWSIHADGLIQAEFEPVSTETPTFKTALGLVDNTPTMIEHDVEQSMRDAGVKATQYGPTFRNSTRFWEGKGYTVLEHRLRNIPEIETRLGSPVTVDPPHPGWLSSGCPISWVASESLIVSPYVPKGRVDIVTRLIDYDYKGGRLTTIRFRTIGSADEESDPVATLPTHWAWDSLKRFDFLPIDELRKSLTVDFTDFRGSKLSRMIKLNKVSSYYLDKAAKELVNDDLSNLPFHLAKHVAWAKGTLAGPEGAEIADEALVEEVRKMDAQEVDTLELMLEDGRLTRYYEADPANAEMSKVVGDLADQLGRIESDLRILEIGGGTAGTTLHVLNSLSHDRVEPSFLNYTFTDISSGFFERAREKLRKWSDRITYKKLDISQDIHEQGFKDEEFDVVIAANVLHATEDMVVTMTNVRRLLQPKGKLILLEANRHPPLVLPFSLLPGWWYSKDDYRDHDMGPMMPVAEWDRLLKDTGFSGVDTNIQPFEREEVGVISSSRIGKQDENPITIVAPFFDEEEVEFAQTVADQLGEQLGCVVETKPFFEVEVVEEMHYVFIDSPRQSIFGEEFSAEAFELLQNLTLHNKSLLWVIPQGADIRAKSIKGIMRTLRLETIPKNLLMLEDTIRDPEVSRTDEQDFVWENGHICLPRMNDMGVRERFAVEKGLLYKKVQSLWNGERALEMTIEGAGSAESIYYQRTDALQKVLADDEVTIEVEAAGFDGVGKVTRKGAGVKDLNEGDRVVYLSLEGSGFANYKTLNSWQVAKVPATLESADAASVPLAYTIAVLALHQTAHLRKSDSVLIHSAAGAVGQACVNLAQKIGAKIFVTAGTDEKREFLHKTFGIPKEQIFSDRTAEFRDGILSATGSKGVNVIVNSLGGDLLPETFALIAQFGRFVDIGKKDSFQNNNLPMQSFFRNVTFSSIDLRDLYKHQPEAVQEAFAQVVEFFQSSSVPSIQPVTVLPISQLDAGLRKLKNGDVTGKIVLSLGKEEQVLAQSDLKSSSTNLKANATYVITGGTRGIGLDLAHWLAENGAHHIVLLSRSGPSSQGAQDILAKYQGSDIEVRAIACDVGSRDALAEVLESVKDMPPVAGVIHSALVLKDLDFFIILSSFLGDSGNAGQAIYAGTSTFYDAFCEERNARGQYSVAIGLPVILDVGYVADNDLADTLKTSLGGTLTMADIRTIMKCAVEGPSSPFVHKGKISAFCFWLDGKPQGDNEAMQHFHPVHTRERIKAQANRHGQIANSNNANVATSSWTKAADPQAGLTEALIHKVATMTMMDIEDVAADVPLASFSLDSLVSVELRNWIRRETTVELTLSAITQSEGLSSLALEILILRGST